MPVCRHRSTLTQSEKVSLHTPQSRSTKKTHFHNAQSSTGIRICLRPRAAQRQGRNIKRSRFLSLSSVTLTNSNLLSSAPRLHVTLKPDEEELYPLSPFPTPRAHYPRYLYTEHTHKIRRRQDYLPELRIKDHSCDKSIKSGQSAASLCSSAASRAKQIRILPQRGIGYQETDRF